MTDTLERIFALSPDVRYVALMRHGRLTFRERDGLAGASSAESDRYEEILVNPTLLTLTGQRGAIDCGGLDYVVIRYGNFFQVVRPVPGGHVSVSVEPGGDPLAVAAALESALPAG
ncbi:MAG TPA: hypothetical protein VFO95_04920 [Gemmatimonadales bacterium]|nr:hypothetical protein [Gemmatimonadales bacterium]